MFFHGSPFFSLDNVHLPPLAVCVSCVLSWADLSCGCAAVSSIHPKITCKLERIWMPHVRSFKQSWDQFLVFYTLHSVILLLLGPKEAWFEDIKKITLACSFASSLKLQEQLLYIKRGWISVMHTSVIPQFTDISSKYLQYFGFSCTLFFGFCTTWFVVK